MNVEPDAAREHLRVAGYSVLSRVGAFSEVLVHGHGERWVGQGVDPDDALTAALRAMLPSRLGRMLLAAIVAAQHQVEPGAHAEAPATPEAVLAPAPAAPLPPARVLSAREVLERMAHLGAELEGQRTAAATMAPALLRARVLVWVARARALDELCPDDREVGRRASIIARRLNELARDFWPGSVRALQMTARPEDAMPGAMTWQAVAERAAEALEKELAQARAAGLDGDGWADRPDATIPQPDRVFQAAVRVIDAGVPLDVDSKPDEAAVKRLAGAVWRLRAVRGRVSDPEAWGRALGQVRRLLTALGRRGAPVRDALDPSRTA